MNSVAEKKRTPRRALLSECRKRGNRFQAIKKYPPSERRRVFFRFDAVRRGAAGRRAPRQARVTPSS
ncbi:hypothetical protein BUC_0424 [Burkholderia pseudomallei 576]|nr:hypothetical protein BUC_0424 [Burkholderia pseudomallei 576]